MSWTHLSDRHVKATRKRRVCELCARPIAIGSPAINRSGSDRGGFVSFYMHVQCEEKTKDWDQMDWECHSPGDGPWPVNEEPTK